MKKKMKEKLIPKSLISVLNSALLIILSAVFITIFSVAAFAQSAAKMAGPKAPDGSIWVDSMDMVKMKLVSSSIKPRLCYSGKPMTLGRRIYSHGIGTNGDNLSAIDLKGAAVRFAAMVGVDDDAGGTTGSVTFEVWLDGNKIASSPLMKKGDKPMLLAAGLTGGKRLLLVTVAENDASTSVLADWGGAAIYLDPNAAEKPEPVSIVTEPDAPIAHTDQNAIGIHGPRIIGATPGKPFVFLIPATGKAPLMFQADNLPAGLVLQLDKGIISGSLKSEGKTKMRLTVTDATGAKAERDLTIVAGQNKLALTPPMGWNSWNVWGTSVDEAKVRASADLMIKSGLASHGFQYVNIDDAWEKNHDENGEITTNEKFPDMTALGDYIHSLGLRFGIYSSPGPRTCGQYEGSYQHEYQDAASYAKWGVDYLKYDWCSYGNIAKDNSLPELQKPYTLMKDALDKSGRDIVFSFCQYGMGNVWEWGEKTGGNLWRTTGDINDSWESMAGIGFSQVGHEKYAGPGHWNDPDMLVVGTVGWGPFLHPTKLTKNEQIVHITLWSMLAAPLLIGADMTQLDEFTFDLLTNDEVLAVNQDPLGRQASRVAKDKLLEVWARPLFDGTVAVALFNRYFERGEITVKLSDAGLQGSQPVRDLWQKKDLGEFKDSFTMPVPPHGAIMLRVGVPTGEK